MICYVQVIDFAKHTVNTYLLCITLSVYTVIPYNGIKISVLDF